MLKSNLGSVIRMLAQRKQKLTRVDELHLCYAAAISR
jgi:hypothetical protein